MKRKSIVSALALSLGMACGYHAIHAATLLTPEQALKEMFPDADEVVAEVKTPTIAELAKIRTRLGGSLVHFQKGSESGVVQEKSGFTFYYGLKNGKKTGVALIEEQPGKWGPVTYVIMLDVTTAKVKNLAVMSYEEKRGRPIARQNFLSQFVGKGSLDPIKAHKDIRAVSGATISSDATCFAVKKVIVVCEELIVKEKLAAVQ